MKLITFIPVKNKPQDFSTLKKMPKGTVVYKKDKRGSIHFHIICEEECKDVEKLKGKINVQNVNDDDVEKIELFLKTHEVFA